MQQSDKRRLALAKNKLKDIALQLDRLDPENPIHAVYVQYLQSAHESYERQIIALESIPEGNGP